MLECFEMLLEEARWWQQVIDGIDPSLLYPMLNVGSSTEAFRTVEQPFIDRFLFRAAREGGRRVLHLDAKADNGVDLVGDLTDSSFRERLVASGFKSVLCSNLLEHVPETTRGLICAALTHIIPIGGYLLVSCPRRFPYHPDPIDTRFRPTPAELAALFPRTTLVASKEVVDGTYFERLRSHPRGAVKALAKLLVPLYKPRGWLVTVSYFSYLFRHFSSSCVVLRKTGPYTSTATIS